MQLEIGDAEEVHAALCYAYNTITSRVSPGERRDARRATLKRLINEVEKEIALDTIEHEYREVPDFPKYEMNRAGKIRNREDHNDLHLPVTYHKNAWPMVNLHRNGEIHTVVVQTLRGYEWPIVQEV